MNSTQFQQAVSRMAFDREQMEEIFKLSAKMTDEERTKFTADLQAASDSFTQSMTEAALPLSEIEKLVINATSKSDRAELAL